VPHPYRDRDQNERARVKQNLRDQLTPRIAFGKPATDESMKCEAGGERECRERDSIEERYDARVGVERGNDHFASVLRLST